MEKETGYNSLEANGSGSLAGEQSSNGRESGSNTDFSSSDLHSQHRPSNGFISSSENCTIIGDDVNSSGYNSSMNRNSNGNGNGNGNYNMVSGILEPQLETVQEASARPSLCSNPVTRDGGESIGIPTFKRPIKNPNNIVISIKSTSISPDHSMPTSAISSPVANRASKSSHSQKSPTSPLHQLNFMLQRVNSAFELFSYDDVKINRWNLKFNDIELEKQFEKESDEEYQLSNVAVCWVAFVITFLYLVQVIQQHFAKQDTLSAFYFKGGRNIIQLLILGVNLIYFNHQRKKQKYGHTSSFIAVWIVLVADIGLSSCAFWDTYDVTCSSFFDFVFLVS